MLSTFLDLRTLSTVLMLITISLSILMIFIWRSSKTYPGFGSWTLANVSVAIGFLLLTGRGILPDFVTIVVANGFTFGSLLLTYAGTRKFLGFRSNRLFISGILILHTIAFIYFSYINKQVIPRILTISIFLAIVSYVIAESFREALQKERKVTYSFASGIYFSFAALMIGRAVLTYLFTDLNNYYAPDWVQSSSYLIFIIYAVSWTFMYLILNNERLYSELKSTKNKFEKMATTDFLTGVNNNRRFFEVGGIEIQRAKRFDHPLTLIMFDIDFFKKINDTYGHAAGDKVLMAIVDSCKFNLRELDVLGRLGGEEFGILLPHTDIDVGKMVASRLRRAFSDTPITLSDTIINVTASFGVTSLGKDDTDLKELLVRADTALYEAKQNGRDQVRAFVMSGNAAMSEIADMRSDSIM